MFSGFSMEFRTFGFRTLGCKLVQGMMSCTLRPFDLKNRSLSQEAAAAISIMSFASMRAPGATARERERDARFRYTRNSEPNTRPSQRKPQAPSSPSLNPISKARFSQTFGSGRAHGCQGVYDARVFQGPGLARWEIVGGSRLVD